jgi:hypothetical protein
MDSSRLTQKVKICTNKTDKEMVDEREEEVMIVSETEQANKNKTLK